jgi:hypothetical protein
MNLLARLAEPAFAKDAPIRLNAGPLGFLIFAFSALYCLGTLPDLLSVGGNGLAALGRTLLIAPLPQLLAAVGGLRMWEGDAKGKLLVVLSLAAGFVWSTMTSLVLVGESDFGLIGVLFFLPIDLAIAAFLYYLVATSEFRGGVRLRDVPRVAALFLKKLDALADPDSGPDAQFTLDARIWGLLIAAYGFVVALAITSGTLGQGLQGQKPTTLLYLVLGASLPAVFAFYGGLRMFLGDLRGKRKVVFAIALGYLYLIHAGLRTPAGACGSGQGVCEFAKLMSLVVAIPLLTGMASLLYFLVRAMRYDENLRRGGALSSTIVTVVAAVPLVAYARGLLA